MFGPVTAGLMPGPMRCRATYGGSVVQRILTAVVVSWRWAPVWGLSASAVHAEEPSHGVDLVVFYVEGCPHCAAEFEFLDGLERREPSMHVSPTRSGTPTRTVRCSVDTPPTSGSRPARCRPRSSANASGSGSTRRSRPRSSRRSSPPGSTSPPVAEGEDGVVVDLPFLGPVDVGDRSLIVATLAIGFIDGINPCSL